MDRTLKARGNKLVNTSKSYIFAEKVYNLECLKSVLFCTDFLLMKMYII